MIEAMVEAARFVISEDVGMAQAQLMVAERTLPLRVVVLRERRDDTTDAPGRELREAVRLPDDDVLRAALRGLDWVAGVQPSAVPSTHRHEDPLAGLTAEEAAWAREVVREWSETSGREVAWHASVYEDQLVELRRGSLSAFVGTRSHRVLGCVERPTLGKYVRDAAAVLGASAFAGVWAGWRFGIGPGLVFAVGTMVLLGVVGVIARPRLHPAPPPGG